MVRKVLFYTAYNLIAIIVFFSFCEILVRICVPEIQPQYTDKTIYEDNRYYDSPGLRPLSMGESNGAMVVVNEYGCRSYSVKIDKNKKNLLLIGDSVTMGIGVEGDSTFSGILQSRLDSINVFNPSISGYDVKDYLNVVKSFVQWFDSQDERLDAVILFWCLNDVYTDLGSIEIPGGKIRYILSDFLVFVRAHSRFYFYLKTLLFDRPESYFKFDYAFYEEHNTVYQKAIEYIKQINQICLENRIQFSLVLLPYEFQFRESESDLFYPQNLLKKSIEQISIKFIDARMSFEHMNVPTLYLYGDGIHFSKIGHKRVAQYLLDNICF